MSLHSWLQNLRSVLAPGRGPRQHRQRGSLRTARHRPSLEVLEDRTTPAFLAPVDYDIGADPIEVVAADFNNDGLLDLATANDYARTVSVLLANADGSFQPALTFSTGATLATVSVAVGDFNADGKLDLATANWNHYDYYAYRDNDVSILLGNGDGTFQAPANIDIGLGPSSLVVGDFNADGKLDLGVVGQSSWDPYAYAPTYEVAVLFGGGTGSFSGPRTTSMFNASAEVVADFNGDGKQDMALTSHGGDYVVVALGDGLGHFYWGSRGNTGDYPTGVAAGDVNGDGKLDVVTANGRGDSVTVLLGDGLGGIATPRNYAVGDGPISVVLGDFNRDGTLDIATSNQGSSSVSILTGLGDGTFGPAENSAAGPYPVAVTAGDFNGDGWLDAATANTRDSVSVLINDQSWLPLDAPSIRINDVSVTEGNTGASSATFTLSLSNAYTRDVTVQYQTADGTATAGSDYASASGDVTIPAGQISQTFMVAVIDDRLFEPSETFAVNLSAATNAFIGDGQGIGTILDDEPRISIRDVTQKEGNGKRTTLFVFTVTLSATYDEPVTVSYRTVDGTATTSNNDYIAKTGTLTFAPGETTKTITIEVQADRKSEANETFFLDLFDNSSNSLFTKNRGIATILNDD